MKILEQSNKVALTRVPKLRFPEFRDSASWDKKEINKLLTIGSGKDYKHLSMGDIPVYGSGGYMLSVNDYLYDGESVCIGRKGTIDKPIFLTGKFWTVDTLFYTHSFIKCSPKFIFYQFQKINWKNYNEAGGIPSLSKTTIGKIEIRVPSFSEQQKIADCLSSLDNVISLQTQKIEALQQYKKGVMQKLFPAERETVPELRFGGFQNEDAWHSLDLGSCLLKRPEYGVNAPAVPFSKELPTYLRITDIAENGSFIHEQKTSVAKNVTDSNYLKKGDIVLARTGASVGKSYLYNEKDGALVFAGFLIRVRPNQKKLNSGFLFQYFKTEQYWKWVSLNSARSGQPGINGSEYSALPIVLPSMQEQQKIADCLSSLDELIDTETQKLDVLRTHKTGLMQQLFPAMDEVNA
ncbi:TPA: restriction endonuclease subunit S [Klebsiella quasipneumoniae subsp. similipneumoniae]|nr:restriction endonuclease subunit S [Klebsiella quasipneumoniae subsp. similipneumoniae]